MEEKIKNLMNQYIISINNVCVKLLKELNNSENICLKSKLDFFDYRAKTRKMEYLFDGIKYSLHGNGCTAFNDSFFLDWDFGYRSRWCGINPWKIAMSLKRNACDVVEYYDGTIIKDLCEQSIIEGIMFQQQGQYYFTIPESQTMKPNFPMEFDTLMIEHNTTKCAIARDKVIDRFIRKSNRIYNQIDENKNCYLLKFVFEGKIIYTIPYDDIGYPENAVKIMCDEILKNMNM